MAVAATFLTIVGLSPIPVSHNPAGEITIFATQADMVDSASLAIDATQPSLTKLDVRLWVRANSPGRWAIFVDRNVAPTGEPPRLGPCGTTTAQDVIAVCDAGGTRPAIDDVVVARAHAEGGIATPSDGFIIVGSQPHQVQSTTHVGDGIITVSLPVNDPPLSTVSRRT